MKGFVSPVSQLSNNFMMFLFIARTGKSQEMMTVLKSGGKQGDFVPASLIIYFSQLNEILDKSPEMMYRGIQY